ncbi:MAG: hypothetical protein KGH61_03085 [Candidatus Micrarchaeota archaeon]|nr:hypothetical protein [Candidatus Micrarchaeota archaeon]MDE1847907.1 hypothetical protein [Candidatus Micrarchaeota archaeon]MDE1864533.1 hypothetical protein [Candidatus Micrarchaeota archaeon]
MPGPNRKITKASIDASALVNKFKISDLDKLNGVTKESLRELLANTVRTEKDKKVLEQLKRYINDDSWDSATYYLQIMLREGILGALKPYNTAIRAVIYEVVGKEAFNLIGEKLAKWIEGTRSIYGFFSDQHVASVINDAHELAGKDYMPVLEKVIFYLGIYAYDGYENLSLKLKEFLSYDAFSNYKKMGAIEAGDQIEYMTRDLDDEETATPA